MHESGNTSVLDVEFRSLDVVKPSRQWSSP